MEFGRVEDPALVDFTLRPDPAGNVAVLQPGKSPHFSFYFGTSQWIDPAYPGSLYPESVKKGQELLWYARQFNCIEFNPSFYAIPNRQQVEKWAGMVQPPFHFCCKIPRAISHATNWSDSAGMFTSFLTSVQGFGAFLGPVFMQLPPHIQVKEFTRLLRFLEPNAAKQKLFVEVRHESWFSEDGIPDHVIQGFRNAGIGLVLSDVSGRRDAAHMALTVPEVLIRWVGNRGHATDLERLDSWAKRISAWQNAGVHNIWFFLHQPDPGLVPGSAVAFTKILRAQHVPVNPIAQYERQQSLF